MFRRWLPPGTAVCGSCPEAGFACGPVRGRLPVPPVFGHAGISPSVAIFGSYSQSAPLGVRQRGRAGFSSAYGHARGSPPWPYAGRVRVCPRMPSISGAVYSRHPGSAPEAAAHDPEYPAGCRISVSVRRAASPRPRPWTRSAARPGARRSPWRRVSAPSPARSRPARSPPPVRRGSAG